MHELLFIYQEMSPLSVGLLLFPLGLVIGSFSSFLLYRLPRGLSMMAIHSQCPVCGHALGPLELIPLLSFLWQRGRCRHCGAAISWRYPLLEAGCGVFIAFGGALGGWGTGFTAMAVWILGSVAAGELLGHYRLQKSVGMSLVEVVVSVGLIALVALPIADFSMRLTVAVQFQRQVGAMLAASTIEDLQRQAYRTSLVTWPASNVDQVTVGKYQFNIDYQVQTLSNTGTDYPSENNRLRAANVTVTCLNCAKEIAPVRMVAIIAKIYPYL